MTAAMLLFGSIGLLVRKIDLSSGLLALARGTIGTVFLLAVSNMGNRSRKNRSRKNRLLLFFSGVAVGMNWIFLFEAYRYTTIAVATLCYYLAPVFVILASPFFLKEKLTPGKVCCAAAAMTGMLLAADIWNGMGGENNLKGVVFGVAAALLYASVVMMNKHLDRVEPMYMTTSQLGTAAVVLVPYVLLTEDMSALSFDGAAVLWLLVVGIVNTGIAYWLYFSSLSELSGQTAALFSYIDPVTAILLSALLLGERMTGMQAAGAALILGAALAGELLHGRESKGSKESNGSGEGNKSREGNEGRKGNESGEGNEGGSQKQEGMA